MNLKLWLEMLAVLALPPLLIALGWGGIWQVMPPAALLGGGLLMASRKHPTPQYLAQASKVRRRAQAIRLLLRFALTATVLILALSWWRPEELFRFPLQRPRIWLMVMLLYPAISVPLQEMLYRSLFFQRYARILPDLPLAILINALLFAWLHVFLGPLSMLLSFVAGLFFAETYLRSRSFALVCLEHALYGNLVFTIGLGSFFYHNPA